MRFVVFMIGMAKLCAVLRSPHTDRFTRSRIDLLRTGLCQVIVALLSRTAIAETHMHDISGRSLVMDLAMGIPLNGAASI